MDSLCGKGRPGHRERGEDSANQEPGLSPSRLNQLLPRREGSSALGAPQQGQRALPPSRNVNYRLFGRLSRLSNPTSVCTLRILLSLIFNPWHFESIKDCESARLCSFYNGEKKGERKTVLCSGHKSELNGVLGRKGNLFLLVCIYTNKCATTQTCLWQWVFTSAEKKTSTSFSCLGLSPE